MKSRVAEFTKSSFHVLGYLHPVVLPVPFDPPESILVYSFGRLPFPDHRRLDTGSVLVGVRPGVLREALVQYIEVVESVEDAETLEHDLVVVGMAQTLSQHPDRTSPSRSDCPRRPTSTQTDSATVLGTSTNETNLASTI